MARHKGTPGLWPPHLATFDPTQWPPAAGEVEEMCQCGPCRQRWGPPGPAGNTLLDAHTRWRKARLATLERGSSEYRLEALEGLREGRIFRDAEQNPAKHRNGVRRSPDASTS